MDGRAGGRLDGSSIHPVVYVSWGTAAPVPLSVILLLLWAATSGYAGLCFRVLSSKWSLQVRPKIKRIRPWISAEKASEMKKKVTFCHTNSTGLLLESKHNLVNFRRAMLSRLLGLADHCIPPKPAKYKIKLKKMNKKRDPSTQKETSFSTLAQNPSYLCRSWELCPSRKSCSTPNLRQI